jgi:pyruvate/2-oxoglutarate dehydrogenase complex dihydrolipoamide dehydrogenase (E3) component
VIVFVAKIVFAVGDVTVTPMFALTATLAEAVALAVLLLAVTVAVYDPDVE